MTPMRRAISLWRTTKVKMQARLVVIATILATSTSNAELITDLAAYWPFDGDLLDQSINGNDGTAFNGASFIAGGRFGQAVSFDGSNDYANMGRGASLDITDALTISLWARMDDAGSDISLNQYFLSKGTGTFNSAANTYSVLMGNFSPNPIPDGVVTHLFEGASRFRTEDASELQLQNLNSTTWYHFVARWDGNASQIFLDGQHITAADVAFTGTINSLPNADLLLGRLGDNTRFYDGALDDVAIWNRALTDQEILTLSTTSVASAIPEPSTSTFLIMILALSVLIIPIPNKSGLEGSKNHLVGRHPAPKGKKP